MNTGNQNHQSGHGANHNRINKRLQQGHIALGHRVFGFNRRMSDCRRANPGFARIGRPLNPIDQRPDNAAARSPPAKGGLENIRNDAGYSRHIHQQYGQPRTHINESHKRHQHAGHFGDRLYSANDYHRHQQGHDNAKSQRRIDRGDIGKLRISLIDLKHTDRSAHGGNGKNNRQPLAKPSKIKPPKHRLNIIHRPAIDRALVINFAIFDRQRTFGKFRCHAKKPGDNHPEHCPRPAKSNRHRHRSNITKSDRARQSRA